MADLNRDKLIDLSNKIRAFRATLAKAGGDLNKEAQEIEDALASELGQLEPAAPAVKKRAAAKKGRKSSKKK